MLKGLLGFLVVLGSVIALAWWQTRVPVAPLQPPPPPAPVVEAREVAPSLPETPIAPPAPAEPEEDRSGPLEFDVSSEADLLFAMRQLGIEDLDAKMTEWAISRGYPEYDQAGNYLLDQPYQQYDDATLRGLAEGEDMWAQQILAQRLARESPGEAMEWYRKAASNGSVYAMQELARLYQRVGRRATGGGVGEVSQEQIDAVRGAGSPSVTAYAWLAMAERSGWDATRASSLVSLVGRKLSGEEITEACELSQSLGSGLSTDRDARGLPAFDRTPPPIVYMPGEWGGGTDCHEEGTGFDMSGCREAVVRTGEVSTSVWICD